MGQAVVSFVGFFLDLVFDCVLDLDLVLDLDFVFFLLLVLPLTSRDLAPGA
jgi:hypothetical protein